MNRRSIQVLIHYTEHDPSVTPERIASFLDQLIQEDAESRDYEEQHGHLDPGDRAFTIHGIAKAADK